jgi:DNA-binding YbaB/EbfC family protein
MARRGNIPGMGNMNQMMRQVQKMQAQMQKAQEEAENQIYDVSVGGGALKVSINGKREIQHVEIDPDVVDPDDVEMLQDLIVAAVNEAIRKADAAMNEVMGKFTGGLGIPGL